MGQRFFNPYPKYLQIREALARRIERGMRVGDQLPTEETLCAEFDVSRETVRQALRGLEDSGLIWRGRGRGTFVRRFPSRSLESRLTGLAEDFSALKFNTEARLLAAGPVAPPVSVAESVGRPADEMLFRILRLRNLDGEPFALHEAFLPLEVGLRLKRLDLAKSTPIRELRDRLRVDAQENQAQIEAVAADSEAAAMLQVGVGAPLLLVTRHFEFPKLKAKALFRSLFRADRYYYTVRFDQKRGRSAPPPAANRWSGRTRKRAERAPQDKSR